MSDLQFSGKVRENGMAGEGCQNALFFMYIRFLRSTSWVKIFPFIRTRWDLEYFSEKWELRN